MTNDSVEVPRGLTVSGYDVRVSEHTCTYIVYIKSYRCNSLCELSGIHVANLYHGTPG